MSLAIIFIALTSCFTQTFLHAASSNKKNPLNVTCKRRTEDFPQFIKASRLMENHNYSNFVRPRTPYGYDSLPKKINFLFEKRHHKGLSILKKKIDEFPKDATNILVFQTLEISKHLEAKIIFLASRIFLSGASNRLFLDIDTDTNSDAVNSLIKKIQTILKIYYANAKTVQTNTVSIFYKLSFNLEDEFEKITLEKDEFEKITLEKKEESIDESESSDEDSEGESIDEFASSEPEEEDPLSDFEEPVQNKQKKKRTPLKLILANASEDESDNEDVAFCNDDQF